MQIEEMLIRLREVLNENALNTGNADQFLLMAASDILGIARAAMLRGLEANLSVVPFNLLLEDIFNEAEELPSDTDKRIQALRSVSLYIDRIADCYEARVEHKKQRQVTGQ